MKILVLVLLVVCSVAVRLRKNRKRVFTCFGKVKGESCSDNNQCASGYCVSGICSVKPNGSRCFRNCECIHECDWGSGYICT